LTRDVFRSVRWKEERGNNDGGYKGGHEKKCDWAVLEKETCQKGGHHYPTLHPRKGPTPPKKGSVDRQFRTRKSLQTGGGPVLAWGKGRERGECSGVLNNGWRRRKKRLWTARGEARVLGESFLSRTKKNIRGGRVFLKRKVQKKKSCKHKMGHEGSLGALSGGLHPFHIFVGRKRKDRVKPPSWKYKRGKRRRVQRNGHPGNEIRLSGVLNRGHCSRTEKENLYPQKPGIICFL